MYSTSRTPESPPVTMKPTGDVGPASVVDVVKEVVGIDVVEVEGDLAHSATDGKFDPELPLQTLSIECNILHEDVVSSVSKTQ